MNSTRTRTRTHFLCEGQCLRTQPGLPAASRDTEVVPLSDLLGRARPLCLLTTSALWDKVGLWSSARRTQKRLEQNKRDTWGRSAACSGLGNAVPCHHSCATEMGAPGSGYGCFYFGVGEGTEEGEINPQRSQS